MTYFRLVCILSAANGSQIALSLEKQGRILTAERIVAWSGDMGRVNISPSKTSKT